VGNDVDIGDDSNQNLRAQVNGGGNECDKGNTDFNAEVQDNSERVLGASGNESQDDLDKDADASMDINFDKSDFEIDVGGNCSSGLDGSNNAVAGSNRASNTVEERNLNVDLDLEVGQNVHQIMATTASYGRVSASVNRFAKVVDGGDPSASADRLSLSEEAEAGEEEAEGGEAGEEHNEC